jgi:hypothetical protein
VLSLTAPRTPRRYLTRASSLGAFANKLPSTKSRSHPPRLRASETIAISIGCQAKKL